MAKEEGAPARIFVLVHRIATHRFALDHCSFRRKWCDHTIDPTPVILLDMGSLARSQLQKKDLDHFLKLGRDCVRQWGAPSPSSPPDPDPNGAVVGRGEQGKEGDASSLLTAMAQHRPRGRGEEPRYELGTRCCLGTKV